MLNIIDNPDAGPVNAWLRDLIDGQFAYVVLMTGEGLRRLLEFAQRDGLGKACISALGKTRTVTRGPKPVRALKEIGLQPTLVADSPTTDGVIATLCRENLQGQTVGVTLYGEPNIALETFLLEAGAAPRAVMPYLYAPAADADRVVELIAAMNGGKVDALIFTSSPQVDRLFEVAAQREWVNALRQGLARTRVAAIGPVLAEHLSALQVHIDICPEQGFVMKNLVQHIKRAFAPNSTG
jgi:uroporphyrinogen-III synthase